MLLTALFFALLAVLAFGLRAPFSPRRAGIAGAIGLAVGLLLAYLNAYPGSVRGALMLAGVALLASGLVVGPPGARRSRPMARWMPAVGALLVVSLVLAGLFPYTAWGARSVAEPIYQDLNGNVERGPAPALEAAEDVRVVPWDLAAQLLERGYGQDASYLDTNPLLLQRHTFPDTVRGEFVWVNAPAPELAKWLMGGRVASKAVYVHNDAANLTPTVVEGDLNVHLSAVWWQDRVGRYAENEGEFRWILEDVALQLDDEDRPYWIGYLARLDLRGQPHMERLLIVDAWTGEEQLLRLDEAPAWLEIVYPERYVYEWASYWGRHREGFLYRWFNADRLVEPDDVTVRYIRLENTTFWLLPMKQLGSAQLGGYILINTRTGDATFYDRFDRSLVDYDTALRQLQAIMASGEATRGSGAIRLDVSEGYLYPIRMDDGSVRDAYVFPLLEGLKISRFAVIDARDYTTKRVFSTGIEDALAQFSAGVAANATPIETTDERLALPVLDGVVSDGKALVNLNGTYHRVTRADLAGGERLDAEREMDELELAIARANRGEAVELEVLLRDGRVVDVRLPGIAWA